MAAQTLERPPDAAPAPDPPRAARAGRPATRRWLVTVAAIVTAVVGTDLAVVQAQGVSGLKAATFGDSDALQVGDTVLAVGNSLGLEGR